MGSSVTSQQALGEGSTVQWNLLCQVDPDWPMTDEHGEAEHEHQQRESESFDLTPNKEYDRPYVRTVPGSRCPLLAG